MGVPNPVADANIRTALFQRATKFGDIPRSNEIKKWPFWMPFIPEPPQDDTLAPFPQVQSLAGMGWPIAAGASRDIPILTEQDAHYNLVNTKLTAFRGPLTGEVTIAANNTAVVGVGTLFTTELVVGDRVTFIDDAGNTRWGVVSAIANNLNMTLEASFPAAITGAAALGLPAGYRISNQWYEMLPHLNGGIEIAAGTNNLNGNGTLFLNELNVGQNITWLDEAGNVQIGIIATIVNNTTATLTANVATATGAPGANFRHYILSCKPHTFNQWRPLTTYLRWTMFVKSTNSIYNVGGNAELLGGASYAPASIEPTQAGGGLLERPIACRSAQGIHDGLAMLYTPYQVPREGTIFIRVHNTHNLYTLFVNGTVFGYKVAV